MTVDLHIHTTYSDGQFSPREIIEMAREMKLEAVAITDHDTVKGLEESLYWGEKYKLEVIPGCEFCVQHLGKWLHLLGYFVDFEDEGLRGLCDQIELDRSDGLDKQINKIQQGGFYLEKGKVLENNSHPMYDSFVNAIFADPRNKENPILQSYVGRENMIISFCQDWIIPGKKLNSPQFIPEAVDVIKIIVASGGVPILAHPGYPLDINENYVIDDLGEHNLAGLEVFTSWHNKEQEAHYLHYCQEKKILMTSGSDFHGKL